MNCAKDHAKAAQTTVKRQPLQRKRDGEQETERTRLTLRSHPEFYQSGYTGKSLAAYQAAYKANVVY